MKLAWYLLAAALLADFLVWCCSARHVMEPPGPKLPPLYQAVVDGDMVRIKALADKSNVDKDEKPYGTPLVFAAYYGKRGTVAALIRAGANAKDRSMPFGMTALGEAVYRGNLEDVQCLLQHGADAKAPCSLDGGGLLPLVVREDHRDLYDILVAHEAGRGFPSYPQGEVKRRRSAAYRRVESMLSAARGRDGS